MKYLFTGLILSLLMACSGKSGKEEEKVSTQIEAKTAYLALGDSYTIGESVAPEERWPILLAKKLNAYGTVIDEVKIVAKTGWTTDELLEGIEQDSLRKKYDMVSLLIGVNNQFRKRDTAEYREQFKILLQKAVAFAGENPENVFVVSIPDYGVTPFGEPYGKERIARDIDLFNKINLSESQKSGIQYIDITPISREVKSDSSLVASDGLHPSAKMYRRWVEKIYPVASEIINLKDTE